jgi:hypothetical protein
MADIRGAMRRAWRVMKTRPADPAEASITVLEVREGHPSRQHQRDGGRLGHGGGGAVRQDKVPPARLHVVPRPDRIRISERVARMQSGRRVRRRGDDELDEPDRIRAHRRARGVAEIVDTRRVGAQRGNPEGRGGLIRLVVHLLGIVGPDPDQAIEGDGRGGGTVERVGRERVVAEEDVDILDRQCDSAAARGRLTVTQSHRRAD